MFYYLIGTAAILLTIVCIAVCFYGDFPTLNFKNQFTQIVCRLFVVIANILLVTAAFINPELIFNQVHETPVLMQFFCSLLCSLLFIIAGGIYYVLNIIGLCLLMAIITLLLKIDGWVFFDDKNHFL